MRLSLIKTRVAQLADFDKVQGAGALAIALQGGQFSRTAFVYLKKRSAGSNGLASTAVSQLVTQRFGVAYWTRDLSDPFGDAAMDIAVDQSDAVVAKLLGYSPDPKYTPFRYASGETLMFKPSVGLVWADEFETDYLIRSV